MRLPKITPADILEFERELYKRSFSEFVKAAWHVLEPGQPYVHNWHMDAICQHLEAISTGEIKRLLINVPPGTSKSSLVSVFHTAWEWGPAGMPHIRFISGSHEQGLAIRDNRRMRMLVSSDWYQERWPMALAGDQNAKLYFENEHSGFRQACSIESMTGRRGDRVAIDDPHSATGALSDIKRETTLTEFRETVPSRLTNPAESAIIVIMQRLHEGDVAGYILEHEHDYVHLCLPMEYEKERHCKTRIGFSDPRTEEGELLFPERFPAEVVEGYKRTMGEYAYAAQFQQRPAPRTGGFFRWERFEVVKTAPKARRMVRYWDKAGTEGGGARTAGVLMSVCPDGVYYVHSVVKGQWSALERERVIRQTAETDGKDVDIWIEQEPGSGGKESAESTIRNLAGFKIKSERPTGEKSVRAEPYSAQVEAGNVKLVQGDWNKDFIEEHKTFPVGKYKDQVDAAAGAFNKLAVPGYDIFGLV